MRKESSTNFENEQILKDYCNAFKTLYLIEGRWKLSILFALYANSCTYTDIKKVLPSVSDRILSLRLKELQIDQLIQKNRLKDKDFYELTDRGLRLQNVLKTLSDWSKQEEENCE